MPEEAAHQGVFPLAKVVLNVPFWVWVDADLCSWDTFLFCGSIHVWACWFCAESLSKGFSLDEVLLVQHFNNGGISFALMHFQFKKWKTIHSAGGISSRVTELTNVKCFQLLLCTWCTKDEQFLLAGRSAYWNVGQNWFFSGRPLIGTAGLTGLSLQHCLWMLLCQQKAAWQCMRDEQGWFLHHWLEESKTKITVSVKHWKMQPKLMEAFVF